MPPKKRKSGNQGVGVDFKRVKHKVGKKLPKAQNETDTSFKARSISLPGQSIAQDKEGIATNFQNLSLKDLLNQVSHYSEKTRKGALVGLEDLFKRHPEELRQHVSLFYTKIAERVSDSDKAVRQALRTLLREAVVPVVDGAVLQPFMPIIMAHVCSAMTHLSLEIRMDALAFLDVLMDHCPALVVSGFLVPCLSHFCDLLSSAHRGRNIKAQSVKALLKVLDALVSFLTRAFPSQPGASTAATASSSSRPPAGHALNHHRCRWPSKSAAGGSSLPAAAPLASGLAASGSTGAAAGAAAGVTSPGARPAAKPADGRAAGAVGAGDETLMVVHRLALLLLDCWTECTPAQLATSPELEPTQAMVAILTASNILLQHLLLPASAAWSSLQQNQQQQHPMLASLQEAVVRRVAPAFPTPMPPVKPNGQLADALVKYNLQAAQLLANFLPVAHAQAQQQQRQQQAALEQQDPAGAASAWVQALVGFYVGALEKGVLLPAQSVLAEAAAAADASAAAGAAAYASVLQGVATAVPLVSSDQSNRLLKALAKLASKLPSKSSTRAACLRIQHGLMTACQRGEINLDGAQVASWLSGLPKLLWELGSSSPDISHIALSMLHDAARFTPAGSQAAAALAALQPQLAPLLVTHLPAPKAKKKKSKQQEGGDDGAAAAGPPTVVLLPGPLSQLPQPLQTLAVDMLYHLGSLDRSLLRATATAAHAGLLSGPVTLRLVEMTVMQLHQQQDPVAALSFLLSLFFPGEASFLSAAPMVAAGAAAETAAPTPVLGARLDERQAAVDAALSALHACAPAHTVLQLLWPQLQMLFASPRGAAAGSGHGQLLGGTPLQQYSLLRLCSLAANSATVTAGVDIASADQQAAQQQQQAAVMPPDLLAALPEVAVQYCVERAASSSGSSSARPLQRAQGQQAWVQSAGLSAGLLSSEGQHAVGCVLQLMAAAPWLAVRVIEAAAVSARTAISASRQQQQAGALRLHCITVLSLLQALLRAQPLKAQLLAHAQAAHAALAALTAALDGAPGHVTSDGIVPGECQRLKLMAEDVLGPNAA